jgi:hypothetical protein
VSRRLGYGHQQFGPRVTSSRQPARTGTSSEQRGGHFFVEDETLTTELAALIKDNTATTSGPNSDTQCDGYPEATRERHGIETSLTREELYAQVWSEPMLKVAARYSVSSSYLTRGCTFLNVPRPERGYWAKLAVGKAEDTPALPVARPGDPLVWSRGEGGATLRRLPETVPRKKRKRLVLPHDQHPLIKRAKALFEAGHLSREASYLKPAKKLLPDLIVTKTALDKALAFADQLFLSLERARHRVVIAPRDDRFPRKEIDVREKPGCTPDYNNLWSPWRCTVAWVETVAIGLTIFETSEEVEVRYVKGEYVREADYVPPKRGRYTVDHTWTTKLGTGRLCLQAYSPYPRVCWLREWRETTGRDLSSRIETIVKELRHAAVELPPLIAEGKRQAALERERWDAQMEQWNRERAEEEAAEALSKSKDALLRIVDSWTQARRFDRFLADAECRAADLPDDEKARVIQRLNYARDLFAGRDALDYLVGWKSPSIQSMESIPTTSAGDDYHPPAEVELPLFKSPCSFSILQ